MEILIIVDICCRCVEIILLNILYIRGCKWIEVQIASQLEGGVKIQKVKSQLGGSKIFKKIEISQLFIIFFYISKIIKKNYYDF